MTESKIKEIISADVRGEISDSEKAFLENNPQMWRDGLIALAADVDSQLIYKKAESLENPQMRCEYEKWKAGAMVFKRATMTKLRDVNLRFGKPTNKTEDIYGVLVEIRDLLIKALEGK